MLSLCVGVPSATDSDRECLVSSSDELRAFFATLQPPDSAEKDTLNPLSIFFGVAGI